MKDSKQSKYLTTFGMNLKKELEQMGLTLSGHHPLLKVSFYTIEVDVDRDRVTLWYGPQQEKLGECDILAHEVVALLKKWRDEIERPIDDELFLRTLYAVYATVSSKIGDPVAIDDILSEYISRKIYRSKRDARTLLAHSIFQSKKREINDHRLSLVVATRAYTRIRKGFIWVPVKGQRYDGTYDGIYISHVNFRKTPRSVEDFRADIDNAVKARRG